jgi:hypothetical protein
VYFDFPDEDIEGHRAKCAVAHVVRLPQLCRDDRLSGGSGLLRENNIAQVHQYDQARWLLFDPALS